MSLHRDSIASIESLNDWLVERMDEQPEWSWESLISTSCNHIRSITRDESGRRAFCVYDSAEKTNVAHAEIFACCEISIEDRGELRKQLFDAFNANSPTHPVKYREGKLVACIPEQYRSRIKIS
jgi:hypothetical protein